MIPLRDENPTERTPIVTILLIVACVAIYFFVQHGQLEFLDRSDPLERAQDSAEQAQFAFENAAIPCEITQGRPLTEEELGDALFPGNHTGCEDDPNGREVFPDKNVWFSVIVSMFLHGSLLHLGGNMLFLWIFGNNIEDHLGIPKFIAFYLLSGVVATVAHVALEPDSTVPVVGASGAIAGVMGAYLVWFPNTQIRTLFIFILILFRDISAKWLLGFWFVLQFLTSPNSGVAWAAHVGGFVFGVIVGLIVRMSRPARQVVWRTGAEEPGGFRASDDWRW